MLSVSYIQYSVDNNNKLLIPIYEYVHDSTQIVFSVLG